MTIKYFLAILVFQTQGAVFTGQVGPFDGLLACEKAASQARAVFSGPGVNTVRTFCASTKAADFKYAEPKK
jgi:hypothetical protein